MYLSVCSYVFVCVFICVSVCCDLEALHASYLYLIYLFILFYLIIWFCTSHAILHTILPHWCNVVRWSSPSPPSPLIYNVDITSFRCYLVKLQNYNVLQTYVCTFVGRSPEELRQIGVRYTLDGLQKCCDVKQTLYGQPNFTTSNRRYIYIRWMANKQFTTSNRR